MNDTSRELRYALGALCGRYNMMVADKDVLDVRLGTAQPFGETVNGVDAERAYLSESRDVSNDLRSTIVEIAEIASRIRDIEGF
jgi:hypothetical protein